jgi:abortive infection bacteriophage resistance protein
MLPPYTKPHLSFADQLALLMQRGLSVTDQAKAVVDLQRISYGRLTPYWQPSQQLVPNSNDASRVVCTEQFWAGAEFRHAVDLYLFDKQLRLLFLDAIERIEVALRVDLAHAMGKRAPCAHRSPAFLDPVVPTGGCPGGHPAPELARQGRWCDRPIQGRLDQGVLRHL